MSSVNKEHCTLQSLSVLTSPLECSQLTFSLFIINFPFLFYLKKTNSWFMETSPKRAVSEGVFWNCSLKQPFFAEVSLHLLPSVIQHLFKYMFFYYMETNCVIKNKKNGWGSVFLWLAFYHSIHFLIVALYVFSLVTCKIKVKILLIPITENTTNYISFGIRYLLITISMSNIP